MTEHSAEFIISHRHRVLRRLLTVLAVETSCVDRAITRHIRSDIRRHMKMTCSTVLTNGSVDARIICIHTSAPVIINSCPA